MIIADGSLLTGLLRRAISLILIFVSLLETGLVYAMVHGPDLCCRFHLEWVAGIGATVSARSAFSGRLQSAALSCL